MRQKAAALQDISLLSVRVGSFSPDGQDGDGCGMSASRPTASELLHGRETTRRANRDLMRRSKKALLFDHFVGAGEQRG